MDHDLTACLPPVPTFDPWFEYYFGATVCPVCFDAALARIEEVAPGHRGDAWAVAARGLLTLGRRAEAERAWVQARALGGEEVDALAIWLEPGGAVAAIQRATRPLRPGPCADAWVDVAALRMLHGNGADAARAIGHALAACPAHREALHWSRFLALPDAETAVRRLSRKPSRRGESLAIRDALELIPGERNGYVSPRRLHTRVYAGPAQAPAGSALELFDEAGVTELYLATPEDWARVPARHPLVRAELDLATLVDLVDEGRPCLPLARAAWAEARGANDPERQDDVAQVLCALGTHDDGLAALGAQCADWLAGDRHRQAPLFGAYRAYFAARLGEPDAAERARAALAHARLDDLSWRLAVEALRLRGAPGEAEAVLRAAAADPARRSVAAAAAPGRGRGVRVQVSPRLTPRDLRAAARPTGLA